MFWGVEVETGIARTWGRLQGLGEGGEMLLFKGTVDTGSRYMPQADNELFAILLHQAPKVLGLQAWTTTCGLDSASKIISSNIPAA